MADTEASAVGVPETKLEEVCRTYRNTGRCRFGDKCKYTHSDGEIIPAPPRVIKPRGVCFNFRDEGSCKFGDRCRFFHGTEEEAEADCEVRKEKEAAKEARRAAGENVDEEDKRKRRTRRRRNGGGDGGDGGERAPPVVEHTEDGQEICRNFKNRGKCRWGDTCNFAHVAGGHPINESKGDGNGGGERRRRRRKPKGPGICYSFRDEGECQYGDECHFKHGEEDDRDFEALRAQRAPAGICYNFRDNGECKFADSCRFSHDLDAEDDRAGGADAAEYDRSVDA